MPARISLVSLLIALVACAEPAVEDGLPVEVSEQEEPLLGEDALVIDFGATDEDGWYAVNDTVMGGVSTGEVTYTDQELIFEGTVSTASNGGFTSVRSPSDSRDLRPFERVVVRMRSEGQPFSMVLAHNPYWFQDQFRYDIEIPPGEWTEIEIPLADFELYALNTGYPTPTGERMRKPDRREILHMEFMSELFEDGPFRLEVDYIAFD